MYKFKAKDSEINSYPLCLGNISKDFTLITWKNRSNRKLKIFSVDYNTINTSDNLGIHRYLMKETFYKIMFGLTNQKYEIQLIISIYLLLIYILMNTVKTCTTTHLLLN